MGQYDTIEQVKGLFVQATHSENNASCYFLAQVEHYGTEYQIAAMLGGMVGMAALSMVSSARGGGREKDR